MYRATQAENDDIALGPDPLATDGKRRSTPAVHARQVS